VGSVIMVKSAIFFSHPTGNQNSRQAVLAFTEAGELSAFATALHFDGRSLLSRVAPPAIRNELLRRDFSAVLGNGRVSSVARVRELTRLVAQKFGIDYLTQREEGWASIDAVYQAVDAAVANHIKNNARALTAVYAYEDGALESFKAAKERGIDRIYELPIGYWRTHRRLCDEEASLKPAWSHTWHASLDSKAKIRRKDEELALATHIIVPSRFVADSLQEFPGKLPPISVVPYGCPAPISATKRRWYSGGRLRVLFVGGLSQRKGLSYLLHAVEELGDAVELTVIGSGSGSELLGSNHRQLGSVPFSKVLEEMQNHDVFVFPSLFEGFGMVITEALSQGMPVIITPNTGPADMITDGVEGWVVPIRDSEAIKQRLLQCIDTPDIVGEMGRAALSLAKQSQWENYGRTLLMEIRQSRYHSLALAV
jgi:starch synthase